MPRIEVTGDICLRRPRPTQGCTADVGDDDDDRRRQTTKLCNVTEIRAYTGTMNIIVTQISVLKIFGRTFCLHFQGLENKLLGIKGWQI